MSALERIRKIAEKLKIEYAPDVYSGDAKRWITYNYKTIESRLFANDRAIEVVSGMQVHLFNPIAESSTQITKRFAEELEAAGFTYPEITVMVDQNPEYRHTIFEFETEDI